MNIDDLKKEIQKVRAPQMDTTLPPGNRVSPADFFEMIRRQDRKDEKFLLYKRIVPVFVGLIGFAVVAIIAPIRTPVMFLGAFLVFLGLLLALLLFFLDYRNISKEEFNMSIVQFLKDKKKRLSYWRSTPLKHHLLLAMFLIGWIMLNLGNRPFIQASGGAWFRVFVGLALLVIILLNINSERLYRRRHKREHEALLKMIEEIGEEEEK